MRLNQVTVPAVDVEQSIAFYERLGFRLIVRSPHYARFELPEGEATFSVEKVERQFDASKGPHVYFEVEDVEKRVAALRARGVQFEGEPKDQSWLWREAWFTDPAGNRLCLFHAGENRRYPPWRVK